jgi:hypothetical protein
MSEQSDCLSRNLVKTIVIQSSTSKGILCTWELLQNPQESLHITQILPRHKLLIVQDHPLVVIGATVAFGKQLGPLLACPRTNVIILFYSVIY